MLLHEEWVAQLKEGKVKDYQLEQKIFEDLLQTDTDQMKNGIFAVEMAASVRREFLKEKTGKALTLIGQGVVTHSSKPSTTLRRGGIVDVVAGYQEGFGPSNFKGIKQTKEGPTVLTQIESCVGGHQAPIGVPSNPLRVSVAAPTDSRLPYLDGRTVFEGEVYVPIAPHETALVAGLNRGMGFVNRGYSELQTPAGVKEVKGVAVHLHSDHMTRSSGVGAKSVAVANQVVEWVKNPDNFSTMKQMYEEGKKHAHLLEVRPIRIDREVHLKSFGYFEEAMGMNGATQGTQKIARHVAGQFGADYLGASMNTCTDKKATAINALDGRGVYAIADVKIPAELLNSEVTKKIKELTDERKARISVPREMHSFNYSKNWKGSARAGTVTGFNGNISNFMANAMLAGGDDIAQDVESSTGYLSTEVERNGDLFVAVTMPCIEVATVGGGTSNPVAREVMGIMGCDMPANSPTYYPGRNKHLKAGIYAAGTLALETNLLLALGVDKSLADSHMALAGR